MIIGFSKCQNSWEQKKGENLEWQVKRWIIYPNASNLMNTLKKIHSTTEAILNSLNAPTFPGYSTGQWLIDVKVMSELCTCTVVRKVSSVVIS